MDVGLRTFQKVDVHSRENVLFPYNYPESTKMRAPVLAATPPELARVSALGGIVLQVREERTGGMVLPSAKSGNIFMRWDEIEKLGAENLIVPAISGEVSGLLAHSVFRLGDFLRRDDVCQDVHDFSVVKATTTSPMYFMLWDHFGILCIVQPSMPLHIVQQG